MSAPWAEESVVDDLAAVDLSAGRYTARFLPGLGMVGTSFTCDGDEYISFHGGADAYRAGQVTGIPLLHPWANRLARSSFEVNGVWVDIAPEPPVRLQDGLPIHGTMTAAEGWRVEAVLADSTRALLQARYVFDDPARLASFPFPHELVVFVELSDLGMRVTTEIINTGERLLPVSFGWHPYFVLPGVSRRDMSVVLPDRDHLVLDGRCLPTGDVKHEAATEVVLGDGSMATTFDDAYKLLPDPAARELAIESAEARMLGLPYRRLVVQADGAYDYAQVYAPADARYVALEPMTAPINALISGEHRSVPPGERFQATFVVRVDTVVPPAPAPDDAH